jgi:hypothetical protein
MAAMHSPTRIPRRVVVPFVAAGALLAVPGIAGAATVDPVYHAGNPTCADIGYAHGMKFDAPSAGSASADGVTVEMSLGSDAFGTLVDWTSSAPIDAVIVKGGPNANAYVYPGESSGDTGLHTPFNGPDKYYGLSHVDFCWDDDHPGDDTPPPPVVVTPPSQPVPPVVEAPPAGDVLGGHVVIARSRLLGPSGCAGRKVRATVKGRGIAKVTFFLDGRKVKVTRGAGTYSVRSSKLAPGVHRIRAKVRYVEGASVKRRTHVVTFQRCLKRKILPRFTG